MEKAEMLTQAVYARPEEVRLRGVYLLRERLNGAGEYRFTPVRLEAYTACPAVVIVSYEPGLVARCLRDDLFIVISEIQKIRQPQVKNPGFSGDEDETR